MSTKGNGTTVGATKLKLRQAALDILGQPSDGASLSSAAIEMMRIIDRLPRDDLQGQEARRRTMREIRSRLGDRWSLLIMVILRAGDFHPGALQRLVNLVRLEEGAISRRVLTLHLRQLERDGLIQRTVLSTAPLSVSYSLRPLGRDLLRLWDLLREWTFEHAEEIQAAQAMFDFQTTETARDATDSGGTADHALTIR